MGDITNYQKRQGSDRSTVGRVDRSECNMQHVFFKGLLFQTVFIACIALYAMVS
jgi:hypothetical protein